MLCCPIDIDVVCSVCMYSMEYEYVVLLVVVLAAAVDLASKHENPLTVGGVITFIYRTIP